jgi:hypothetical protein
MNFRLILTILVCLALFAFLGVMAFGLVRTGVTLHSDDQVLFVQGQLPQPLPNGIYNGTANGYDGTWKGKEFDRAGQKGINIFSARGIERRLYPFSLSTGRGIKDREIDVVKIDYDIDANPFWLRPVLDEVVEIEPGIFLGKLQYRLLPNYPFTITFFHLEQP